MYSAVTAGFFVADKDEVPKKLNKTMPQSPILTLMLFHMKIFIPKKIEA